MRACARDDEKTALAAARGADLTGFADLAIAHGIAGCAHQCLGAHSEIDAEERHRLAVHALQNRVAHKRVDADLHYLAEVLEPIGVPWLVVKGPAVAATLYAPPEVRNAGDIDVLVEPAHFATVLAELERAGHPVDDANWPLIRRLGVGQLHVLLPEGTPLDLHWHLIFSAEERARYALATDELVARRRAVSIVGMDLATLDPIDTLVHLAFHAANEGADRLSWLSDVRRASAVAGIDWDVVVSRTTAWRMQLPVGTVLLRAIDELDAPIPRGVPDRLLPTSWRATMSALDRMFPVARTRRRFGTPASLLAKSSVIAPTPMRATGAAVTGLASRAARLVRTGDATRHDHANPTDVAASLSYHAADSHDARAAYFADVRAQ
jgi:hypothetical protein